MKKSQKQALQNLFILIGVLLLIGAYVLFKALPDQKRRQEWGKISIAANISRDDVNEIDVMFVDGDTAYKTHVVKVSNTWQITSPFQLKADQATVDKLLTELAAVKSEDMLTNITPQKFSEFGFDSPSSIIQLTMTSNRHLDIVNGRLAQPEKYYYTMLNNQSNTVYVVYAYKFTHVEKKPEELANRDIFRSVPLPSLKEFEMRSQGVTYRFVTKETDKGTEWQMVLPVQQPTDNFEVKRKLMEIYTLIISKYKHYQLEPGQLAQYGLDNPQYYIKITDKDNRSVDLAISAMAEGDYFYAYSSAFPGIVMIHSADIGNKLQLSAEKFLPKPVQAPDTNS